jgi:hypothetical protein
MRGGFGVILASACLGFIASCGGQGGNKTEGESVHFTDIACPKSSFNALNSEAANMVIKTSEEFEAIWLSMGYGKSRELPSVDFSKGPLVMVYGGQRGTSNEWVVINDIVRLDGNKLLVKYDNFTANHPGCGGAGVISYPFCIVQVDTDAEEVEFRSNVLNACEVTGRPDLE